MEANQFIDVFSEIGISAVGKSDIKQEYEAHNVASIICSGLSALSEFGGVCGSRTAYLMKVITDKFDKNDSVGKEVHNFMNEVNIMVIEANRYVWDFSKISTKIEKMKDEFIK